ncbi:hypothetical protein BGZ57DRAFT_961411 [Hyaloscypha finlandica]|nr:hypothetical protein BGZ57DRAFT_961411 [Hyaloscypha finlandica]
MFALAEHLGYGANTTIEIEIGTTATDHNCAEITGDFTVIVDGAIIVSEVLHGTPSKCPPFKLRDSPERTHSASDGVDSRHTTIQSTVITINQQISGYFLDGPRYSDVAVLGILSFERRFSVQSQPFVQTLISDARVAGKTKITIGLSGNGGGDILLGYDLSRQFFPKII